MKHVAYFAICYELYCLQHVIWKIENYAWPANLKKYLYQEYIKSIYKSVKIVYNFIGHWTEPTTRDYTEEELHDQSAHFKIYTEARGGSGVKKTNSFPEDPSFLAPTWGLTTVCNSRSEESDALFWPLQTFLVCGKQAWDRNSPENKIISF